jgi:CDGSH-type Zn-finger protein
MPGSGISMPGKDTVIITPYRNGPILVRGPIELAWPDGSPVTRRRDPVALCRCGKSKLTPFCDGTHKLIGFRAPGAGA